MGGYLAETAILLHL